MKDKRQDILIKNMQSVKSESDATQAIYNAMEEYGSSILNQLLGNPSQFKILLDELTLVQIKLKDLRLSKSFISLELLEIESNLKDKIVSFLVYQNIQNIENKIKDA